MEEWNHRIHRAHRLLLRYAQSHPGTLTLATLVGSGLVGMSMMCLLESSGSSSRSPQEHRHTNEDDDTSMTLQQARLLAMIENAQEADSWKQNVEQAVQAQEQFMFPGGVPRRPGDAPNAVPTFMQDIEARSRELMKEQEHEREVAKRRKATKTRIWDE